MTVIVPETPATSVEPLTLHDMCDQEASGAVQAYVRMSKGTATLDLCAHHFALSAFNLMLAGWDVAHDRRAELA